MRAQAGLLLGLAAAALLAFGAALNAPPAYDDQIYLQGNPFHLQPAGAVVSALASRRYFALTDERSWQPLVTALESAARGRPAPVRAAALAAWVGCGALVASLAAALGAPAEAAAVGALLFTLFPAAVEALAVASFSGHVFALFWVLTASRLFLAGSGLGAAVALAFGLTAKESAVTLLPALGLLSWATGLPLRRMAPALAVFGVYAVWRWGLLEPPPPIGELAYPFDWTLPWQAFGFQIRHLAVPWPLCLERSFDAAWGAERIARFVAPLAWAGLAWVWRRERPRLAALAWVAAAAAPVSHVIAFANLSPAADRYLLAGAAPAAVAAALWAGESVRRRGALAAVALGFGALAVSRSLLFLEPDALSAQTEACAPQHPRALALRGAYLYGLGRPAEAAERFEKAFALQPALQAPFRDPGLFHLQGADYVLGLMRLRSGKAAEAEPYLRRAVAAAEPGPARAAACDRLGDALLALGRPLEARAEYRRAATQVPAWAMPWAKMAGTMTRGEVTAAVPLLERALALSAGDSSQERAFRAEVAAALSTAPKGK